MLNKVRIFLLVLVISSFSYFVNGLDIVGEVKFARMDLNNGFLADIYINEGHRAKLACIFVRNSNPESFSCYFKRNISDNNEPNTLFEALPANLVFNALSERFRNQLRENFQEPILDIKNDLKRLKEIKAKNNLLKKGLKVVDEEILMIKQSDKISSQKKEEITKEKIEWMNEKIKLIKEYDELIKKYKDEIQSRKNKIAKQLEEINNFDFKQ